MKAFGITLAALILTVVIVTALAPSPEPPRRKPTPITDVDTDGKPHAKAPHTLVVGPGVTVETHEAE